jgi:hypothetical protein
VVLQCASYSAQFCVHAAAVLMLFREETCLAHHPRAQGPGSVLICHMYDVLFSDTEEDWSNSCKAYTAELRLQSLDVVLESQRVYFLTERYHNAFTSHGYGCQSVFTWKLHVGVVLEDTDTYLLTYRAEPFLRSRQLCSSNQSSFLMMLTMPLWCRNLHLHQQYDWYVTMWKKI